MSKQRGGRVISVVPDRASRTGTICSGASRVLSAILLVDSIYSAESGLTLRFFFSPEKLSVRVRGASAVLTTLT